MRNARRRDRYARQLDRVKEDLAYLKLWQGVGVVTDISVVGWLVATVGATQVVRALAVAVAMVLTFIIVALHHHIGQRIKLIESL